jgi:protoporphyrinogen oxidase
VSDICILGTGMAAFGAAYRMREEGVQPILFDKRRHYGGHTASFNYEGKYTFDEGPHISFTKDQRLQDLFAECVDQRYETSNARVNNYWKGYWIKHPAQVNLYGLPPDLIVGVIKDFITAQGMQHGQIENYEQWLRASFGNTFAETFPMVYTIKYHTTEARNISLDWIGPRLYRADIEEVLRGALSPSSPDVHYINSFRYPSSGGFVSYLRRFMDTSKLHLDHEMASIDPRKREVSFRNGVKFQYAGLVSSVPLPELVPRITGAPREVIEAASKLAYTEVVVVTIVVDRPDLIDAHWTYIYDQDIFFTRLSTPHMQSPNNVPPGCGSIQAECYYSKKYHPRDRTASECIEPTIRDLRRIGILRDDDTILFQDARLVEYANVIFDLERSDALKTVHGFLDESGIAYCGRYGDWGYIWTDQAFISGEKAAQRVLERRGG